MGGGRKGVQPSSVASATSDKVSPSSGSGTESLACIARREAPSMVRRTGWAEAVTHAHDKSTNQRRRSDTAHMAAKGAWLHGVGRKLSVVSAG